MPTTRPQLDQLKAVASIGELLARERRARLQAERRLVSMQEELLRANASLDAHSRRLASEIKPLRREAEDARGEAGRAAELAQTTAQRLHDALDATPDGFAIYDAGLDLVTANQVYMRSFDGLEEMGPGIAYRRVLELCADEGIVDIGMLRPNAWVDSMEARVMADVIEPVVLRLWDGSCVRMIHRRTANGDLVALAVDITATLEREAELEEARHKAEASSRAKSAFLANMSHELRTPLGGILGMAGLLVEDDLSEDQKVQIEVIRASGEALLGIVDDVLDLGRIEGARMALRPEPFEPRAVIEEVIRALRPSAMERGLTLEADVDEALPPRLVGDPVRVRQALTNLVGNAVKFTPQGHVTIRAVGAGSPSPGLLRLHLSVEDTGIGIEEAEMERMFGAFEQAQSDRDRSHDGAGLGLTLTRRLVEMMGGELWADSTPGAGSCFGFRIDLPVAGNRAPPPRRPAHEGRDAPPGEGGRTAAARDAPLFGGWRGAAEEEGAPLRPARPEGAPAPDAPSATSAGAEASPGGGGAEARPRFLFRGHDEEVPSSAEPDAAGPTGEAAGEDAMAPSEEREGEPAKGDAADTEPVPGPGQPAGPRGEPRRMRVLAAEDNKANRLILKRMLAGLDIDLTMVEDGAEAVEAAARERPDLILMDISMPGMDGKEATRRIRASGAGGAMPIVAVTAHALPGDEESIRAAGLDDYVAKPLRKDAIRAMVLAHAPAEVRSPDGEAAD